jgi:phage repressor protein C with HTH and peptisase S24 domain
VFAGATDGAAAKARDEQSRADAVADAGSGGAATDGADTAKPAAQKFGMLDGVLARCLVQVRGAEIARTLVALVFQSLLACCGAVAVS